MDQVIETAIIDFLRKLAVCRASPKTRGEVSEDRINPFIAALLEHINVKLDRNKENLRH